MTLENLVIHITLPAGLTTVDGLSLKQPVTFDIVSSIEPFYSSVDQVKIIGGANIRALSDLAIAAQIYMSSKEVDLMNFNPPLPSPMGHQYPTFVNSRNQWVTARASRALILSVGDLTSPGGHVLGPLSVTKQRNSNNEGTAAKLVDLDEQIKLYDPAIRSGGMIPPGGHARHVMAAKGVNDWMERTPSRLWIPNGAGANAKTIDGISSTGGRRRSEKFYLSPTYSPSIATTRLGTFQSGLALQLVYNNPVSVI